MRRSEPNLSRADAISRAPHRPGIHSSGSAAVQDT